MSLLLRISLFSFHFVVLFVKGIAHDCFVAPKWHGVFFSQGFGVGTQHRNNREGGQGAGMGYTLQRLGTYFGRE